MRRLILIALLAPALLAQCTWKTMPFTRVRYQDCGGVSASGVMTFTDILSAPPGANVPAWKKYALVSIANTVNGCANANGCWQVNGTLGAIRSAELTQNVVLFELPANGFVEAISVKNAVVCSGTTTALSGLGTASSTVLYRAQTYNIAAAVSATNFTDATPASGRATTAAENVVASLITTSAVQYVDTLAAGCAIDYWLKWSVLP